MPHMLGSVPVNRWEQVVYRGLKEQLPQAWVVSAGVPWSVRSSPASGSGRAWVRDGEADFVVIAPGVGICIVEVKGTRNIRVDEHGRWSRLEGRSWVDYRPRSPLEQATSNAHQISRLVQEHLGRGVPLIRFGYLVVFPQGSLVEGELNTFDPSTVAFEQHLGDLRGRITNALRARGDDRQAEILDEPLALRLAAALKNAPLKISPAADAAPDDDDDETIHELTRQQFAALSGLFRHPRVAVTGPAGSGKTVLALWRLRALVEEGRRALYLCFNRQLAEYLRLQNPDLADSIRHADQHFLRTAQTNVPDDAAAIGAFFEEDLPGLVIDAMAARDDLPLEDLIIDEGQDFGDFRLWAAQSMLAADGSYLYCADDRQDLYDRQRREAAGVDVVFSLVHNCRNVERINETGNRTVQGSIPSMPGMPTGLPTTVEVQQNRRGMATAAWRIAAAWVAEGRSVAILSPYRLDGSSMKDRLSGQGCSLVADLDAWAGPRAVLFSTIKSFKGLEADAVVVIDIDTPGHQNPALQPSDLYVACTRAKHRLALLCRTSEAARSVG